MTNQQRAAMQMALEALVDNVVGRSGRMPATHEAITALREALAQPDVKESLTAQTQGSWVDLTDDEMQDCHCLNGTAYPFALAIIAKFKSKNTPPVVPQGEDDLTIAYMVGYEKGKDEAKEKAAKVCEKEMQAWINFDEDCHEASAIKKCAAAIRSMK